MTPRQGGGPRTPVPNVPPRPGVQAPSSDLIPDADVPPGEASSAPEEAGRPCTPPSDRGKAAPASRVGGGREGQQRREGKGGCGATAPGSPRR